MHKIELSIILACRNEESFIENSIIKIREAITYACLDGKAEIIIVDGKSDDDTPVILFQLANNYQEIQILTNNMITTPYAFNLGIDASRGRLVSILGVHWKIEKDYFSKLLETMTSTQADVVGGVIVATGGASITSKLIARAMQNPLGTGLGMRSIPGNSPPSSIAVDTVPGGMFKRDVYERIGPFNPNLVRNQDDEWMTRVRNHGFKIFQNPAVKIIYHCRSSFNALAKQYFQYGYYKIYTLLPGFDFNIRQILPVCLVLYLLIGLVISLFPDTRLMGLTSIFAYFIIILLQTTWTVLISRSPLIDILSAIATITMQVSYGSGIWLGVLRWKSHPVIKAASAKGPKIQ